jgi:prophage regulatory protein
LPFVCVASKQNLGAHKMRLIRKPETLKKTGLPNSGMYALIAADQFPKPVKLSEGGRAVAWIEAEIDAWIESRIAASRGAGTKAGAA